MRVGAFLSYGRRSTQFRVDLRIGLRKRLHDFLRVIFVHDFGGLPFSRSIGISELGVRRREYERQRRAGTKRRAPQNDKGNGEKFWHKARVLSSISARPATDFFRKSKLFRLTSVDSARGSKNARLRRGFLTWRRYSDDTISAIR